MTAWEAMKPFKLAPLHAHPKQRELHTWTLLDLRRTWQLGAAPASMSLSTESATQTAASLGLDGDAPTVASANLAGGPNPQRVSDPNQIPSP